MSLKNIFWKVYHHCTCFGWYYKSCVFSTGSLCKLDSKFGSFFTEELKIINNLIQYLYLFIPIYPLQYAKRLVTSLQCTLQGRCVVWITSWALQIHCNPRIFLGANQLVSKGWIENSLHSVTEDICNLI